LKKVTNGFHARHLEQIDDDPHKQQRKTHNKIRQGIRSKIPGMYMVAASYKFLGNIL